MLHYGHKHAYTHAQIYKCNRTYSNIVLTLLSLCVCLCRDNKEKRGSKARKGNRERRYWDDVNINNSNNNSNKVKPSIGLCLKMLNVSMP